MRSKKFNLMGNPDKPDNWFKNRIFNGCIDRYCIKEERREHLKENKKYFIFTRWWDFHYSDGTTEQLIMREKFKK